MKRSLHIGINDYPGTRSDLHGCVNDAKDWQQEMVNRGFNTQIILNDKATKGNMFEAIDNIIKKTQDGDVAVITFSGHGTWVKDASGDEKDGRDEALCPYDTNRGKIFLDDELFMLFNQRRDGAHVVFISDSCHSGTMSRAFDFTEHADECPVDRRFLDTQEFRGNDITEKLWTQKPIEGVDEEAVVFFSGCADTEYSYDASFNGRPNGAFTYVALKALKELNDNSTYQEWYSKIRETLPQARYPQTPKLLGSNEQISQKIFDI